MSEPTKLPPTGKPKVVQTQQQQSQAGYQPRKRPSRTQKRSARARAAEEARYSRWSKNRLAIPYSTDGPKVTFGVIWFVLIVGAPLLVELQRGEDWFAPIATLVLAIVGALAGAQTASRWFRQSNLHAAAAGTLVAACVVAAAYSTALFMITLIVCGVGAVLAASIPGSGKSMPETVSGMLRAVVPVSLAAGSLVALVSREYQEGAGSGMLLAIVLLVSAYEAGDFLVGSGANNAVEGPASGIIALAVVGFGLYLLTPSSFPTSNGILLFVALTALCCPLGQMFASLLLPSSISWAPALRRLDSYLLAAPIWLGLAVLLNF